jgi:hypothetical protein
MTTIITNNSAVITTLEARVEELKIIVRERGEFIAILRNRIAELEAVAKQLLHQIDINDFQDSNGHSLKMFIAVHDLRKALLQEQGE